MIWHATKNMKAELSAPNGPQHGDVFHTSITEAGGYQPMGRRR